MRAEEMSTTRSDETQTGGARPVAIARTAAPAAKPKPKPSKPGASKTAASKSAPSRPALPPWWPSQGLLVHADAVVVHVGREAAELLALAMKILAPDQVEAIAANLHASLRDVYPYAEALKRSIEAREREAEELCRQADEIRRRAEQDAIVELRGMVPAPAAH